MDQTNPETPVSYSPPDRLPPPVESHAPNFIPPVVLGLVAAVVMGGLLFVVGQFFYIYILYNSVIGFVIGRALTIGIKKGHFTNETGLLGLSIACSLLAYAVFNYLMYQSVLADFAGAQPSFGQFLMLRAEHEPLIGSFTPGVVVSIIVWVIEAGITWFFAFSGAMSGVQEYHVESVPREVTEFILRMLVDKKPESEIDHELRRMGWSLPEDQDKAKMAAASVITMMEAEQEG